MILRYFGLLSGWIVGLLCGGCVLLVALIGGYALLIAPERTPQTSLLPVLSAPVRIDMDAFAIPSIHAENDADAMRALGYLHARHRLFQMEMMRRTGQGRLAEWLGPPVVKFDRYIRALDLYHLAEQSVAKAPPEERAILDAYAEGVNAWISDTKRWPPVELWVIGLLQGRLRGPALAEWRPADSVVWGKLMALQLSGNVTHEIRRGHLLGYYGADLVSMLTRFDHAPPAQPHFAGLPTDYASIDWPKLTAHIPRLGPERASNAWVLDGTRTNTGKPFLANDPHLGLNAPILWYMARINTPNLRLEGVTVPGVPFHILGQNDAMAWGFTTTGSDVNDLVLEQTIPEKPGFYRTENGPMGFATRTETIGIAGGKTEELHIRMSRHGIILSDLRPDLVPSGQNMVVALQTTLTHPDDTTWRALYHLNRARNQQDFVRAVGLFQLGQQNIFYADRAGHIGFYTHARLPVRPHFDGSQPVPGWTGQALWRGWRSDSDFPPVFNPPGGVLANANDAIEPPGTEPALTRDWEAPWRARRLYRLLHTPERLSRADQARIMTDDYSMVAEDLLPILLAPPATTALQQQILTRLAQWDRHMRSQQPEPLIFTAWLEAIQEILLEDRPGDLLRQFPALEPALIQRLLTRQGPGSWCDLPGTDARHEDCADIIQQGLTRALSRLQVRFGTDWLQWRWGDAHQARLSHPVLGQIPILGDLFTWGGPMAGASDTLLRAAFMRNPDGMRYDAVHGAGYRAIYDLAAPDQSMMILATGQEGRPFQPHFADMMPLWLDRDFLQPAQNATAPEYQLWLKP